MTTIASAQLLSCGFGGIGPYVPPPRPNAWMAAAIDVTGASSATTGLRAIDVELRDDVGHVVARGTDPTLAVIPSTRAASDHSRTASTPFDGKIPGGSQMRLLVESALDVRLDTTQPRPRQVRVTLVDDRGDRITINGIAIGPWPTA